MKTFLSIEIQEQKVRYLLVEQDTKALVLKGAGESTFQVGPSAPGALASFIEDLVAEKKVKVDRLFLTVNRRDAIVHQFNLGKVSKGDLEEIISAEIEKIPSFLDKDFNFVYQQYEVKTRSKIIFGAMTDNLSQYLGEEIKETRIPCHALEMAPLNLAGLLRNQEYKDGPQALIVLSEFTTYLVIIEEGQIRYLYSTNLSQEIFGDASATANWAQEIKRAIKSYVLETKGTIDKAWLIWDQQKAPDFATYLQQELDIKVRPLWLLHEYFHEEVNPIYTLAAVPLIYHLENIKPSFSLTHFLQYLKTAAVIRRVMIAAVLLILVTGGAMASVLVHFVNVQRQAVVDTREVQDQINDLQLKSSDILKERDNYLAMRRELMFQATYVKFLKNMSWSQALSVVAYEIPHELSLMSFKVDEAGVVTFTGEALRMESISKLLRTIDTSSILDRGQFSYLTEAEVEKKKVFHFGILADIKTGERS